MKISMEFIKPLGGVLKKYKALLPSVVVLTVAVLLFFPLLWLGGKVKSSAQTSAGYASQINSLDASVEPRQKEQQVKSFMDQLGQEAETIQRMAVQSSHRDLVTYDYVIFPQPNDTSSQVYTEYGRRYRTAIESLFEKMNAKDAPSQTEIASRTGIRRGVGGAVPANRQNVLDPRIDALCVTRAKDIALYANPDAFRWYDFWSDYEFTNRDQALQDCWNSQVALWIYEDLVDTAIKMNGASDQVSMSPVKRILGVRFDGPVILQQNRQQFGGAGGGLGALVLGGMAQARGGRDVPNYVTATLPSNFTQLSPTGRVSDEVVDVVHFATSVIVDNRYVMTFMKELCSEKKHSFYPEYDSSKQRVQSKHNQISILESTVSVVDPSDPDHELYRYGKTAAMRLDLVCEYLFVREGYDMIKPDLIKELLGQTASTDAATDVPAGM